MFASLSYILILVGERYNNLIFLFKLKTRVTQLVPVRVCLLRRFQMIRIRIKFQTRKHFFVFKYLGHSNALREIYNIKKHVSLQTYVSSMPNIIHLFFRDRVQIMNILTMLMNKNPYKNLLKKLNQRKLSLMTIPLTSDWDSSIFL